MNYLYCCMYEASKSLEIFSLYENIICISIICKFYINITIGIRMWFQKYDRKYDLHQYRIIRIFSSCQLIVEFSQRASRYWKRNKFFV